MRVPVLNVIFGAHPSSEWQPVQLVTARAPPALIVHGLDDNLVHPREAVAIDAKLRAAHVPVDCRLYTGAGHMAPVAALSLPFRPFASTLADVQQFIERTVAAGVGSKPELDAPCTSVKGRITYQWENPPRPLGRT
jgi:acetyl esterase/lipase